jgi:hypothetical protein
MARLCAQAAQVRVLSLLRIVLMRLKSAELAIGTAIFARQPDVGNAQKVQIGHLRGLCAQASRPAHDLRRFWRNGLPGCSRCRHVPRRS